MENFNNEPIEIGTILRKLKEERSPFYSKISEIYHLYHLVLNGVWAITSCTFIANHLAVRELEKSFEFYLFSFFLLSSVIEGHIKNHTRFRCSSLIFETGKSFSGSILLFNRGVFDPYEIRAFGYTLLIVVWTLDLFGNYLFYLLINLNLNRSPGFSRISIGSSLIRISFNLFVLFSVLFSEEKISKALIPLLIYFIVSTVILAFRLFLLISGKSRFLFLLEDYVVPLSILSNIVVRNNPFQTVVGGVIFYLVSFLFYIQISFVLFIFGYRGYQSLKRLRQVSDFITRFSQRAPVVPGQAEFECSICLERSEMSRDEEWRRLECQHHFHRKCIDTWALTRPNITCPNCRREIV